MRRGRKIAVAILTALMVLVAGAGAAFGVLALTDLTDTTSRASAAPAAHTPATSPAPAPTRAVAPTPTVTAEPEPEPVLEPGDRGKQVRELQARLAQLAWYFPPMTGDYDPATRKAVRGFQAKRGFDATGVVDERTWRRVVSMSRTPTGDEMFNRAGPTLSGPPGTARSRRRTSCRARA